MSEQSEFTSFESVTLEEIAWLLDTFPFTRKIDALHLHHTERPTHRQYRGQTTIAEVARQHVEGHGLETIAQHITVAPDGTLWLGRNWNLPPASATGHNGNEMSGPFMITMIGNFDRGQDNLLFRGDAPLQSSAQPAEERQGNQTLQLIALLQNHFDLDLETLRLHREMGGGTSPGSTIDERLLLRELRKARAELRKAEKAGKGFQMANHDLQRLRLLLDRFSRSSTTRTDNPVADVTGQYTDFRDYNRLVGRAPVIGNETDRALRGPDITPAMLDELAPHVINLTLGYFSQDGVMETDKADVNAIFDEHLVRAFEDRDRDEPLRIVFYAHGGLVGEKVALEQAYQHVPWWRKNNVYPIYFVWETDLLPMFMESLRSSRDRALAREAFTDNIVEMLARGLGGPRVWQAIKSSAQTAIMDELGGARYVVEKLKEFLDGRGDAVELHAIGHSAGSIFHSFFVPYALDETAHQFETVQFLAPAITVHDFKERMVARMGNGINHLPIFTMRKELERNDPVATPWYNRSILYLVSHAMEPVRNTAILGLEESLRADRDLKKLFGLQGRVAQDGEVIWATTLQGSGRSACGAVSHVQFNCDPPTMNSVLRRVVGADDNDPIESYPDIYSCGSRSVSRAAVLPAGLEQLADEGYLDARAFFNTAVAGGVVEPKAEGRIKPQQSGAKDGHVSGGGRRRALCIGIDDYTESPLGGCVADAKLWARTLRSLGFDEPTMLLDDAATRGAIVEAFTELVTNSRAGDVVVIQFAGHGIFLPDVDGDEAGEDSPADEAICPVDFHLGAYLIDDDIRAIFDQLPDGVNLTCFFDCCHSGTVSRLGVGRSAVDETSGEKARYLRATPERIAAHRRYRRDMGFQRQAASSRGPASMRDVVFSACLSTEVALESNGHGHFTLQATGQLDQGIVGVTNDQFYRNVVDAFGSARRQTPYLDCAPAAYSRLLLQPIAEADGAGAANGGAPTGESTGVAAINSADRTELVDLLHKLLAALE